MLCVQSNVFPSVCARLSVMEFLVYVNAGNQAGSSACERMSCLAWPARCHGRSGKPSVASVRAGLGSRTWFFKQQQLRCEVSRGELYLISCVWLSQPSWWWCQMFCERMMNSLSKILPVEGGVAWFMWWSYWYVRSKSKAGCCFALPVVLNKKGLLRNMTTNFVLHLPVSILKEDKIHNVSIKFWMILLNFISVQNKCIHNL